MSNRIHILISAALLYGLCSSSSVAAEPSAEEWLEVGNHYWQQNDPQRAISAWSAAIEQNPELATAYFNRCIAQARLNDLRAALNDCTQAFMIDPQYASAWYYRGVLRSERLGDDAGSIADFDRALAIQPDLANAYFKRGNARLRSGDPAGAMQDYSKAIELQPGDADAHYNLGVLYAQKNDVAQAKRHFKIAAQLHGEQGNAEGKQRARQALDSFY